MDKAQRRAVVGVLVLGILGGVALSCSGKSGPSTTDLLPADKAVESWIRAAPPKVVKSDEDLYTEIDGGAPKYIDRGWVSSVYATYTQDGLSIQVAIHDMANSENAQAIYNFDLPVSRVGINEPATAVIDMALLTAYRSIAHSGRFYIEVSIDAKSDAALVSIKAVMLAILSRNASAAKS